MAARSDSVAVAACGHFVSDFGALHVLGSVLGQLEQWCDKCGAWVVILPPKKSRKRKADPGKDVLF